MAEFKLSLVQRKNIKDKEEKLQENLQIIKDATGCDDWAVDIDWGAIYPTYKLADTPGSQIYDSCMTSLASNIQSLCKNEDAKNAFNTAVNQHKIVFNVDAKASSYWSEKINNGCFEIGYKGSICNVSELGCNISNLLTTTYEDVEMPLKLKKGIDDSEEGKQTILEKLNSATGRDFTLKVEWTQIMADHMDKNYPDRIASSLLKSCLGGLVDNIENVCKTEFGKESFNSAASSGNIIFNSNKNDKKAQGYFTTAFVNGDLIVSFKSICNVSEIGNNIQDILTCPYEDVAMPYKLRLQVEKSQEKHQELHEKLNAATGRTFTLKIEWDQMIKDHMQANNPGGIGSSLLESCFEGLIGNISTVCKTEFGKESFNNASPSGNIIFNSNKNDKKATGYFIAQFVNGDLIVSFKSICNVYDIGSNIQDILTCPYEDVAMPYKLRLQVEKSQEKHEEIHEKLNAATGRTFTLKIEWDQMIKDHMQANNPGGIGSSLLESCFGGLVDNIVKLCNDKDFSGKDVFNEFASTGNIIFNSNKNDKKATGYFNTVFVNGDVVVSFKSICNVYDIGSNIPELLVVDYEEVKMPYLARKSIAQSEEKREEKMGIINTATGRTMELSVDWAKMLPFMLSNNGRPSNVGSTLFDSVLGGLAENLKKLCNDELGKEGFNEACSTGKIILTTWEDKKASGYFNESFVNGDLVIAFKSICNCYDIGSKIEKLL